jgi:exopolysaccharide biosynthesis polyprenyl glycosylphosphotransferase
MIPRRFLWLFDILTLAAAFLLAYALVPVLQPWLAKSGISRQPWIVLLAAPSVWTGRLPPLTDVLWILATMVPTTVLFLEVFGNYRPLFLQSRTRLVLGTFLAPIAALSVLTLVLYAVHDPAWSRLFIFSFVLMSGLGLAGYRALLRIYHRRRRRGGYYTKNVVVIGLPGGVARVAQHLAGNPRSAEYHLMGWLSLSSDQPALAPGAADVPWMGAAQALGDLLVHHPIHEVILVHPTSGGDWIKQVILDCDYFRVGLRIVPEALLFAERKDLQVLYHAEPLHLPAVVLRPLHLDSESLFLKRLFDVVISATLLVLLTPLLGLIALAIKLTTPSLPILYPWRVVGHNGVEFTGYKFTTMVRDADARKAELMHRNEMTGPVFKIKEDPRVTPLGRFLRKYSLNELPQLWSVLRGDMSLVGPRPAGPQELQRYEFWHKRKLSIQPGITCLWQVRGRNQINNFDDWVKMDLEYIDNWSLWLDFKILIMTAWVVLSGTGS